MYLIHRKSSKALPPGKRLAEKRDLTEARNVIRDQFPCPDGVIFTITSKGSIYRRPETTETYVALNGKAVKLSDKILW